jgi:hypothetical protein
VAVSRPVQDPTTGHLTSHPAVCTIRSHALSTFPGARRAGFALQAMVCRFCTASSLLKMSAG